MGTTTERLTLFEHAEDILGFLIASYSTDIYQESKKPEPDQAQIALWSTEKSALLNLRRNLRLNDTEASERIIATYGPKVRELHKQLKSS